MDRDIDTRRMRKFVIDDDWIVVVGKTDVDNDYLSIKFSDPRDHWFHVKDLPGSHALLLYDEAREPRRPILEQAASIAAWYSKGKKASKVPVTVTKAAHVSKKRGAPTGQVLVKSSSTLKVKPGLPEES
jgi:predicted ribosome quality control (RQC) complex YloA/Tae2 family protein